MSLYKNDAIVTDGPEMCCCTPYPLAKAISFQMGKGSVLLMLAPASMINQYIQTIVPSLFLCRVNCMAWNPVKNIFGGKVQTR